MSRSLRTLDHCNPGNWKLGVFYFCRTDPRVIVPKRIRALGWTLNFARPLSLVLMAAVIAFFWGVVKWGI